MGYHHTQMVAVPVKSFLTLDKKIALEFHKCAENTPEYPHDYGEMRQLRIEKDLL